MLHVRALVHTKAINHQLNAQPVLLYSLLISQLLSCPRQVRVHSQLSVKSAAYIQFNYTEAVLYVNYRSP
jgi:hypothetical protein